MANFFIIFLIIIFSFIPIMLWGYIFSSLNNTKNSKKMFLVWIFAWMISVLPILYFSDLINYFWIWFANIFEKITSITWINSLIWLNLATSFIIIILSIIPFLVFWYKNINKEKIYIFLKNTLIFLFFAFIISLSIYFLNSIFENLWIFSTKKEFNISFWDIIFNSIKLVIFYYIIIWLIEELSKFFCFNYSSILKINSIKKWVLYSIFVALWFAFLENILYFTSLYKEYWISKELLTSYISRNIFSITLHTLCTSIFAYFFTIWYLKYKYKLKKEFLKLMFLWFILSILLHSLFNISVTLNIWIIIFLYLIWTYFYITYIFYKENWLKS